LADTADAMHEYGVTIIPVTDLQPAVAVIAAVAHQEYRRWSVLELAKLTIQNPVIIDLKGIYDPCALISAGMRVWRL
jgi:UDP-N-acetyl-D-galactosamine dehydrogenase